MADYLTTLSVVLPAPAGVPMPEAQSQIVAWMKKIERQANALHETDIDAWSEQFCGALPDLTTEVTPGISLVWIYSDDAANVEATASVIQDYLVTLGFAADQAIFFSWASTCSKPRVNESDGGGCVVTRDRVFFSGSRAAVDIARKDGCTILN